MSMITKFCHTGNFHNIMLKYVPKRIAFSYEGMVARTMLAALDNNNNVGRRQSTDSMGEKQWKVQWSKRTKSFVVKQVVDLKDYSFRKELTDASLDRLQNSEF
ncbi:uncharacterized protein LOC117109688 [Anneissia japonica]|uniref:uncharacterized protein LOC117109688 n=1 Tax=Anneissia japonica TaxID=1529436 RepID=UPI001425A7A5|nr:uncharacterized protein LOC117109688 [Anneissia japonica]